MSPIERDRVAAALRDEFSAWIAGHPNAGVFDWNVAAENVLRAANPPGTVEALERIGSPKARIEALEVIAGANENTMRQWEGEAKRLRHQLAGTVDERDRLREVLRAVLMEPDPIKRNQLAAAALTNPGGAVAR